MSEPTDPPTPKEKKPYEEPRLSELGSIEEQTRVNNDTNAIPDRGSS